MLGRASAFSTPLWTALRAAHTTHRINVVVVLELDSLTIGTGRNG